MRFQKLAAVLIVALGCRSLAPAQGNKVAFIKGGEIWTAIVRETDIGQQRQLTNDKRVKRTPVWSPDGSRIVYSDTSPQPNAVGALVVIASDGSLFGQYPISTVTATGIEIAGMRWVDTVGWFDNENVFAIGEISPYMGEHRVINLLTGTFRSFGGFNFSSCPSRGIVGFWDRILPQTEVMTLYTSLSKRTLLQIPKPHELPTLNIPITWDLSCTTIAFVNPRPPAALSVISVSSQGHEKLGLPPAIKVPLITAVRDGFVIGSKGEVFYRHGSSRLEPTPTGILASLRAEKAYEERRRRVEAALGALEADWWPKTIF